MNTNCFIFLLIGSFLSQKDISNKLFFSFFFPFCLPTLLDCLVRSVLVWLKKFVFLGKNKCSNRFMCSKLLCVFNTIMILQVTKEVYWAFSYLTDGVPEADGVDPLKSVSVLGFIFPCLYFIQPCCLDVRPDLFFFVSCQSHSERAKKMKKKKEKTYRHDT